MKNRIESAPNLPYTRGVSFRSRQKMMPNTPSSISILSMSVGQIGPKHRWASCRCLDRFWLTKDVSSAWHGNIAWTWNIIFLVDHEIPARPQAERGRAVRQNNNWWDHLRSWLMRARMFRLMHISIYIFVMNFRTFENRNYSLLTYGSLMKFSLKICSSPPSQKTPQWNWPILV